MNTSLWHQARCLAAIALEVHAAVFIAIAGDRKEKKMLHSV